MAKAERPRHISKFYTLTNQEWARACTELKPAELKVLYYLRTLDPFGDRPLNLGVRELAAALNCNPGTVSRALKALDKKGWIDPDVYGLRLHALESIEFQVRDRLNAQLHGLPEVKTPAGRIDLLTSTEIIEVKRIGEWKSGLGQILVYSAFYPEHQKRLHLFGRGREQEQIPNIAASCLSFDVQVTFEVVSEVAA